MPQSAIQCRNLSYRYNGHQVLDAVTFDIAQGDFVAVLGPNGGGKTTLLKLILGLLTPTRGSLLVLGRRPHKASHLIGYVPQVVNTNPGFPISVLDVVMMGGLMPGTRPHHASRRQRRNGIEALERMNVQHLAGRHMSDLSGGQCRRVYIARALMPRPRILLLDEPTAGIDPRGQNQLYGLLEDLNADTTIMMVSHDLMAISGHVKSVACVNRRLHYHDDAEITPEMLDTMYPGNLDAACPVELVAHGVPHRVLRVHEETEDD
jgi:zinc transport system ATP-binding protein